LLFYQDIILDDSAFNTASADMAQLKVDTEALKTKLETMYTELTEALNTPAGLQFRLVAWDVLIKPIEDMILVFDHISSQLEEIISTGYYKDVFVKFEDLNQSIN
jgi:hypothetical protein